MRRLVGSDWGADRTALKAKYIGLIQPGWDYGSVVYRSAACTPLKETTSGIEIMSRCIKNISDSSIVGGNGGDASRDGKDLAFTELLG